MARCNMYVDRTRALNPQCALTRALQTYIACIVKLSLDSSVLSPSFFTRLFSVYFLHGDFAIFTGSVHVLVTVFLSFLSKHPFWVLLRQPFPAKDYSSLFAMLAEKQHGIIND